MCVVLGGDVADTDGSFWRTATNGRTTAAGRVAADAQPSCVCPLPRFRTSTPGSFSRGQRSLRGCVRPHAGRQTRRPSPRTRRRSHVRQPGCVRGSFAGNGPDDAHLPDGRQCGHGVGFFGDKHSKAAKPDTPLASSSQSPRVQHGRYTAVAVPTTSARDISRKHARRTRI